MRLIPGKTKVRVELFKGVRIADIVICAIQFFMLVMALTSTIPGKYYIAIGVVMVTALLLVRMDEVPNYDYILQILRHFGYRRKYIRRHTDLVLLDRTDADAESEKQGKTVAARSGKTDGKSKATGRKGKGKGNKAAVSEPETEDVVETDAETDNPEHPEAELTEEITLSGESAGTESAETEMPDLEATETALPEAPVKETKSQKKKREKQEAREREARRKQEDAILKDPTASREEKDAIREARAQRYAESAQKIAIAKDKTTVRSEIRDLTPFTSIEDDLIGYAGRYFGAVIEIPPVEFRFFSEHRRNNSIENALGRVLRSIPMDYAANIVKIDRPVIYDSYIVNERAKIAELKKSYETGLINEQELKARMEVLYSRIDELEHFCTDDKVIVPYYYLVLYDNDVRQLNIMVDNALTLLRAGEMQPHRLKTKELAVFLKYTNEIDFDEREIDRIRPEDYVEWATPYKVDVKGRTVEINNIITHNWRVTRYPNAVDDAWMAGLMSIPNTKVVIKVTPMDRTKAMRGIDRSLQELRDRFASTGVDSRRIELQSHIESLSALLAMLQGENETLLECNVFITGYDISRTRATTSMVQPPVSVRSKLSNMKKVIKRTYQEAGFRINAMEFSQMEAYIGSQISAYDPLADQGRGIPSNTVAAAYPWIYSHVSDLNGIKLGTSDGVPVFIDFFRRDSERVNSNLVVVGKSGSGKSYSTKSLLTNIAADDSKIFILDPENEYAELAENLHGKFINVGNAQYGRLNPFHIITALDDDDEEESGSNSYATHLQFLEEFFRQILPDCEKDALEYLNALIDRMYTNKGITAETNLSRLRPEDYPVFDDLYDTILEEFQSSDNEYIRNMLRILMNYVSKFAAGGRNASIWNGPSSVTTEENFTVFNFQSLLANRNGSIANAQMLLVLKYIDNEIIKNRDYNIKYGLSRKIVVVIDEAHVFIDTKYPVALDFMFQLAKRIRKYNGMQIVITQNIKDFVGSEEIARKSTAIINACQYSFIFSLAPNDMDDLCRLYEKAGGINENEQEQIVSAPRGQAFTVMSPQSRSSFRIEVPERVHSIFSKHGYVSELFGGEEGSARWEALIAESRERRSELVEETTAETEEKREKNYVTFVELTPEELAEEQKQSARKRAESESRPKAEEEPAEIPMLPEEEDDLGLDFDGIPEDLDDFLSLIGESKTETDLPAEPLEETVFSVPEPEPEETVTLQKPAEDPVQRESLPVSAAEAATPVVIPTPAAASPELERLLSQLGSVMESMSKFSYDAMMQEMQRMIREAAPESTPPAAEPISSETPTDFDDFGVKTLSEDSGSVLGSIFNEDALKEAAALNAETDSNDDFDLFSLDSEDSDDSGFDIMAMLAEEADRLDSISPIEMMVTYEEEVVEITLEELAAYNRKNG